MEHEDLREEEKNDVCTAAGEADSTAAGTAEDAADIFPMPGGIGEKQAAAALAMVREHLPPEAALKKAGATAEEFADWIRDGAFPEYVAALARGYAEADAPYVWNTLLGEAKDGNVPAIRLYFDILCKKQPASASREGRREVRDSGDPAVDSLRSDLFGL